MRDSRDTRRQLAWTFMSAFGAAALLVVLVGCAGGRVGAVGPCAEPCDASGPPPCPPCGERKSGEVWCRVWIPPVTKMVEERVCVKPESRRTVWIPPQYGTRPKVCCVESARLEEHVRPPVWGTQTREVMVRPERERWCRVCCPPGGEDPCGISPQECWRKECEPAVWGKECVPVCVAPERYCVEYTPAKYKVVEERYLVQPGRCAEVCEPAEFEVVSREVCVCPGHWEWRRTPHCEVPDELPALQVEMKDYTEAGVEEGIFRVGDIVRYDLAVLTDVANSAVRGLKVVFTLPAEMEFVSGSGTGLTVTGSGQSAQSSVFDLAKDSRVGLQLLVRVKSAPASNLVQFTASVRTADGLELATETESTTVAAGAAGG